jgi:hypothetical protein
VLGGEFDLADHRFSGSARLHQRGRVHGNTGADYDQVLSAEGALAVAAGFDRDAVIERIGISCGQLIRRLGVGNGNAGAAIFQEQGRSHSRLAQANHQNALVFEIHAGQVLPQRALRNTEDNL